MPQRIASLGNNALCAAKKVAGGQWSVSSYAVILSEAKNLAPGVSLDYEILRRLRLLRMTDLRLGAKKRTPPAGDGVLDVPFEA